MSVGWRYISCPPCRGTGYKLKRMGEDCTNCHGQGYVNNGTTCPSQCTECYGGGTSIYYVVTDIKCNACGGDGVIRS